MNSISLLAKSLPNLLGLLLSILVLFCQQMTADFSKPLGSPCALWRAAFTPHKLEVVLINVLVFLKVNEICQYFQLYLCLIYHI